DQRPLGRRGGELVLEPGIHHLVHRAVKLDVRAGEQRIVHRVVGLVMHGACEPGVRDKVPVRGFGAWPSTSLRLNGMREIGLIIQQSFRLSDVEGQAHPYPNFAFAYSCVPRVTTSSPSTISATGISGNALISA